MYICNECGRVCEQLKLHREHHTELTSNPYETYELCPYCSSEDVEEADFCAECGVPISRATAITGDDLKRRCENCAQTEEIRYSIGQIRRKMKYGNALRIDGRAFELN